MAIGAQRTENLPVTENETKEERTSVGELPGGSLQLLALGPHLRPGSDVLGHQVADNEGHEIGL